VASRFAWKSKIVEQGDYMGLQPEIAYGSRNGECVYNLSSAASLPFSSSKLSVLESLELEHKMFMVVCVLKGAVRNDDVYSLLSVIKT
jgi:hypothetical protein